MSSFKRGMKKFANDMVFLLGFILLSFIYFTGVLITFFLASFFGKRFLDYKKKDTYWIPLNLDSNQLNSYYRQF